MLFHGIPFQTASTNFQNVSTYLCRIVIKKPTIEETLNRKKIKPFMVTYRPWGI